MKGPAVLLLALLLALTWSRAGEAASPSPRNDNSLPSAADPNPPSSTTIAAAAADVVEEEEEEVDEEEEEDDSSAEHSPSAASSKQSQQQNATDGEQRSKDGDGEEVAEEGVERCLANGVRLSAKSRSRLGLERRRLVQAIRLVNKQQATFCRPDSTQGQVPYRKCPIWRQQKLSYYFELMRVTYCADPGRWPDADASLALPVIDV